MAELGDPIARIAEALKEPVRIDPTLNVRVMEAIARLPEAPSAIAWWRRSWTLRVNPVGTLAAAAALVLLVVGGRLIWSARGAAHNGVSAPAGDERLTEFVLVAPHARSVAVVGDFNDWDLSATPLVREDGDGVWWVAIPLPPGRYRYAFLVDGATWRSDPNQPPAEDEFGLPRSVITVEGA